MEQNNVLKFNEKELFNSEVLHQYDKDGQLGFLGYLLRYKQWEILDNNIIFPEIKQQEELAKALVEYTNDKKIENIKIRQQELRDARYFGIEHCERSTEQALKHLLKKKENLEKNKNWKEVLR